MEPFGMRGGEVKDALDYSIGEWKDCYGMFRLRDAESCYFGGVRRFARLSAVRLWRMSKGRAIRLNGKTLGGRESGLQ